MGGIKGATHPAVTWLHSGEIPAGIAVGVHHVAGHNEAFEFGDVGDVGILDTVIVPVVDSARSPVKV